MILSIFCVVEDCGSVSGPPSKIERISLLMRSKVVLLLLVDAL